MTPSFRLALLPALLVALPGPVLAQEGDEPPPADGEPDVRLWKEPCDLDGKGGGELLRVSGSSAAGNMSQGRETYRVQRGPDVVLELTQEGRPQVGPGAIVPEGERWTLTCSRGAIRVKAGEAELRLAVAGKTAKLDAKWLQGLASEKARDVPLTRLEATSALLDGLAEEPAVAGADEGVARVGLLIAERALDAGETDRADAALQDSDAGKVPALAAWERRVAERLDTVRRASPIRVVRPVRIGTIARPVTVPVGKAGDGELSREPDVFWSRASLCVREEGNRADTMRCWDAGAASWREPEPYVSPYAAGPKLKAQYLGNAGGYATRLTLEDSAGEHALGEFQSPSLLARDARGGVVVHAAAADAARKGSVAVQGYDAAVGVGSVLAGGGKYFFDGPASLRSVQQPGRSWDVATPGGEDVACVGDPLTSPDERRAACLAAKPGAPRPAVYELWLFELEEAPAAK